jgi:hypothetical protein
MLLRYRLVESVGQRLADSLRTGTVPQFKPAGIGPVDQ